MLERVGGVKKVAEHVSGNYELMHSIVREVRCELEAGRKVVELKEFGRSMEEYYRRFMARAVEVAGGGEKHRSAVVRLIEVVVASHTPPTVKEARGALKGSWRRQRRDWSASLGAGTWKKASFNKLLKSCHQCCEWRGAPSLITTRFGSGCCTCRAWMRWSRGRG
jgi:hypothetical protein